MEVNALCLFPAWPNIIFTPAFVQYYSLLSEAKLCNVCQWIHASFIAFVRKLV